MSGVPGDAGAIVSLAHQLAVAADVADTHASRLASARRADWTGEGAEAFRARAGSLTDDATAVADRLRSASGTLQRYAEVLLQQRDTVLAAERQFADARGEVARDPLDLAGYASMLRAGATRRAELAELEHAAIRAASELATLAADPGWGDNWFDPFGWFDDDRSVPRRDVGDDVVEKSSFEPWDIQQREIGSCALLSTLSSLMRTDRGDEWLRDRVRWDAEREGYWVTLYDEGRPVRVFVDHVYGHGANQRVDNILWDGSRPSLASLYETAVAQHIGYDDLEDGIARTRAMELITGQAGVEHQYVYPGPSSTAWQDVFAALNRGDPVSAGTMVDVGGDGSWEIEVHRRGSDGALVTDEVDLRGNHAYAVVGAEPDGSVWVVNPWGPHNGADGGGPFLVSRETFADLFSGVAYAELP